MCDHVSLSNIMKIIPLLLNLSFENKNKVIHSFKLPLTKITLTLKLSMYKMFVKIKFT